MNGGDIILTMESTDDIKLFEEMALKDDVRSFSGSLEFYEVDEGVTIRTIAWDEAYIYALSESIQNFSPIPMTQTIAISPLRLDINEIIGHVRSLSLGRKINQHEDAILFENLLLRIMGFPNIQRDGTDHDALIKINNPSRQPNFK